MDGYMEGRQLGQVVGGGGVFQSFVYFYNCFIFFVVVISFFREFVYQFCIFLLVEVVFIFLFQMVQGQNQQMELLWIVKVNLFIGNLNDVILLESKSSYNLFFLVNVFMSIIIRFIDIIFLN